MADDLRSMGGMYRDEIEERISVVHKEITRLNAIVCGNGRPGLEEKIMGQVTHMLAHQKNNWKQDAVDIEEMVSNERKERKEQHAENRDELVGIKRSQARLEKAFYAACGVFMVLKFFGIENILKMIRP